MFKFTATIVLASSLLALIASQHLTHVWRHSIDKELYSRKESRIFVAKLPSNKSDALRIQATLNPEKSQFCDIVDHQLERMGLIDVERIKAMSDADLYAASSIREKYDTAVRKHNSLVYHAHYRLASAFADQAISLRSQGTFHEADSECCFADCLTNLGRYHDARKVLETITLVDQTKTEKSNPGPYLGYRQVLRGSIYVGLHEYEAAVVESQKRIPPFLESRYDEFDYNLCTAYVGLGDGTKAARIYKKSLHNCGSVIVGILDKLIELTPGASAKAHVIATLTIERAKTPHLVDRIPLVEFVADILERRGFQSDAHELRAFSETLKQQ